MQLLQNHTLDHALGSFFFPRATEHWAQRRGLVVVAILLVMAGAAQAGPFSVPGHPPSSMLAWATSVEDFERGPMDIAFPALGLANFGVPENTLGVATLDNSFVYSLGDGGWITLYFGAGIGDGAGDDLAVYENGFFTVSGLFAEYAFVEVSTNGIDFVRFAADSLRDFPVDGGEETDPSNYRNFAGDQELGMGTGFDLAELSGDPDVLSGDLDLNNIRYVRIVDVVGDGSTLDSMGFPVYDPYPTPFGSGGFDLEAVGVLNEAPEPGLVSALGVGVLVLASATRRRLQ